MKLSEYPNLSKKFKQIYKQYLENGADPHFGLMLVDDFLEKYQFYPEALIFKARMLIALSKNKEAMKYLNAARKIDEWKVTYAFDKAELLSLWDRQDEAIECIWKAVESLLREAMDGTNNYLLSSECDLKKREHAEKFIKQCMIRLILDSNNTPNLNELKKMLRCRKGSKIKNEDFGVRLEY